MVNILELSPGMRVKIVDEGLLDMRGYAWGMADFRGKIVTVEEVRLNSITIEEDSRFIWRVNLLDHIVCEEDFEPATAKELELMLFSPSI